VIQLGELKRQALVAEEWPEKFAAHWVSLDGETLSALVRAVEAALDHRDGACARPHRELDEALAAFKLPGVERDDPSR
jgi:hypothetical protein